MYTRNPVRVPVSLQLRQVYTRTGELFLRLNVGREKILLFLDLKRT